MKKSLTIAVLAWALCLAWLAARSDRLTEAFPASEHATDYYNLLVEGFRQGHLAMNLPVDPDLLSPDGAIRNRANHVLDAALYRGKYYLYYGVVPAVTLLWPFTAATGREMDLAIGCLIFLLLGWVASGVFVRNLFTQRERGNGAALAGLAAVALVPGITYLATRGSFYELPVAGGYAFACLFWLLAYRIFDVPGRLISLAGASLCFGLMVGCRPSLIFYGPALVALILATGGRRPSLNALVAGIAPAALIGAGLAWYNAARFGSPFDFGFNYGQNSFFGSGNPLNAARFIPANLRWYLITMPGLQPGFPFVFPIGATNQPAGYSNPEAMQGFITVTALLALLTLGVVAARLPLRILTSPRRRLAATLLVTGLFELLFLSSLGIRASRYAVEFLTPVAFLCALMIEATWTLPRGRHPYRALIVVALLAVGLEASLGSMQQFDFFLDLRKASFQRLSHWLNPDQRLAEMLGAPKAGPVEFTVTFTKPKEPQFVVLVRTGTAGYTEALEATVLSVGYMNLGFARERYAGYQSDLIPVVWGHTYTIRATMGSLYPAEGDPYWSRFKPEVADRLRKLGQIWLDGKEVLQCERTFYPGTPGIRAIGPLPNTPGGSVSCATVHSAKIGLPLTPDLLQPRVPPPALYQLAVYLPPVDRSRTLPLLCEGDIGRAKLLFLDPVPHQRYRLGLDEMGNDLSYSPQFDVTADDKTHFEVLMGPAVANDPAFARLLTAAERASVAKKIIVWCNGALVAQLPVLGGTEEFRPIVVGKNKLGFSTACDDIGAIDNPPEDAKTREHFAALLLNAKLGASGAR